MYTEIVSYSGQARGFRPYALLGVGALSVGLWAALAGAGVAAADNGSSRAPGAAVSATPTASASATKSSRQATRSAKARAAARGLIDQGAISLFDLSGQVTLDSQQYTPLIPIDKNTIKNPTNLIPDTVWKFNPRGLPAVQVGSADNMTYSSPSRATPAASATATKSPATKSTRPTTRGAGVRAGATAGVVDLTGGAFTDFAMSPGVLDQLGSSSGSQPSSGVMNWATTAGADYPKYRGSSFTDSSASIF